MKCPKCGRTLQAEAEITVHGGEPIPVFSCPQCVTTVDVVGETMELPRTFILGPDGKHHDPGNPGGEIEMAEYE